MTVTNALASLVSLGFTDLEARIYAFLVEQPPATAYRIAKEIDKPVANTYKAVESLRQRGAVLIDDSANRLCRAVAPETLLNHLERDFRRRRIAATTSLSELRQVKGRDGVYRLSTSDQVFERCAEILKRSTHVALIDAFAMPLAELAPELVHAARRGVLVAAQVYQDTAALPGVHTIHNRHDDVTSRWAGQWVTLVADGAEYVAALLSEDGRDVQQAMCTASPHLAWAYHSALSGDLLAATLRAAILDGASMGALRELLVLGDQLRAPAARGYQELARMNQ